VVLTDVKVLLTGATGWLGTRVLKAVTEGLPDYPEERLRPSAVRVLLQAGDDERELRRRGVETVVGDIRDAETISAFVKGAEGGVLIHTAGVIHPPGRSALFDEINHRGTLALADAAQQAGLKRLVAMSSNSPMGANPAPDHLFSEDSPYNPYMGYGRSKHLMELGLRRRVAAGGMEVVIIRAPWFYGPGQPPRQSLFFSMIKEGRFPIFGGGENRRSMAYIDTLAQGILRAATHPDAAGEIFWIADERAYPMVEIVETVATVLKEDFGMQVSSRRPRLPGFIADGARLADTMLQAAGLYHQKIHVLSEMNLTIACSTDKARRVLGFAPKVALREGMRRSIAWCLEAGTKI
jgi:nucleoside-diphosphate-sugar epimerase